MISFRHFGWAKETYPNIHMSREERAVHIKQPIFEYIYKLHSSSDVIEDEV